MRTPGVLADAAVYREALRALVDQINVISRNNPEAFAEILNEVADTEGFAKAWEKAMEALGR